jgi:hypothetical protein
MDEIFANPVVELDFFGYLYFCQACCAELGSFVNMIPEAQYLDTKASLKEHHAALTYARNQIEYLKGLLNARIDLVGSGQPISDEPVSVSLLETEPVADNIDTLIDSLEPNTD